MKITAPADRKLTVSIQDERTGGDLNVTTYEPGAEVDIEPADGQTAFLRWGPAEEPAPEAEPKKKAAK